MEKKKKKKEKKKKEKENLIGDERIAQFSHCPLFAKYNVFSLPRLLVTWIIHGNEKDIFHEVECNFVEEEDRF